MPLPKSLKTCLTTVILASALLTGLSSPAHAATQETGSVEPAAPASAPLTATPTTTSTGVLAPLAYLYGGCDGMTMNVHKSAGFASVHAKTYCRVSGHNKNVATNLGYVGWFGERYAMSYGSKSGNGLSVETFAKSVCSGKGWQTWRASSTHRTTIGNTVFLARTGDDSRFNC